MDQAINRSFIIYLLLDSVLATCCEFGRLVAIVASIDDDDNEQNFSHTSDTQSCVDRIIITHMDSSMCRATMCTMMCFDRLSRWWFSFVVVPFLSLSYLMGFFERASLFWRRIQQHSRSWLPFILGQRHVFVHSLYKKRMNAFGTESKKCERNKLWSYWKTIGNILSNTLRNICMMDDNMWKDIISKMCDRKYDNWLRMWDWRRSVTWAYPLLQWETK